MTEPAVVSVRFDADKDAATVTQMGPDGSVVAGPATVSTREGLVAIAANYGQVEVQVAVGSEDPERLTGADTARRIVLFVEDRVGTIHADNTVSPGVESDGVRLPFWMVPASYGSQEWPTVVIEAD